MNAADPYDAFSVLEWAQRLDDAELDRRYWDSRAEPTMHHELDRAALQWEHDRRNPTRSAS